MHRAHGRCSSQGSVKRKGGKPNKEIRESGGIFLFCERTGRKGTDEDELWTGEGRRKRTGEERAKRRSQFFVAFRSRFLEDEREGTENSRF